MAIIESEEFSPLRIIFSLLLLVGSALALATLIYLFFLQPYEVEGDSMSPTLNNKDQLVIWKLLYVWSNVSQQTYVLNRGDIIVFHKPDFSDEQLVKRIIGLPGERVVIKNNTVIVYNQDNPKGFNPDKKLFGKNLITSGAIDVEVKDNEVFVLGDNRSGSDSLDSRSKLGNIDLFFVVGKLKYRILPLNKFTQF